eukprot:444308-Pyramimonas_sp.AAC.1
MPLFAAADFNVPPSVISKTGLADRGDLVIASPKGPMYFTQKSQSQLEYLLVSRVIGDSICSVSAPPNYPLSPCRQSPRSSA